MSYLTILLIFRFIIITSILETVCYNFPQSLIGGALNRCNVAERMIFYAMPFASDFYVVLAYIDHKYPKVLPKIDWNKMPKSVIY